MLLCLSFVVDINRRRRGGNVEIRRLCFGPDFQARWKEGETRFGVFPAFHGASFPRRLSFRLARSPFARLRVNSATARARPSRLGLGSFFRSWPISEAFSPKSCARMAQERRSGGPSTGGTPLIRLHPASRRLSCASIHRALRCGERCAPAGQGCCRPGSDRQSARASGREESDW